MPNRFLQKLFPSHDLTAAAALSAEPQPNITGSAAERLFVSTESLGTSAFDHSRPSHISDARRQSKELGGSAASGRQRSLGQSLEQGYGGGRFARIRGLLSAPSKASFNNGVFPPPASRPGPVLPSGSGAMDQRCSATGSVTSGGRVSCSGQELDLPQDVVDVVEAGPQQLPRKQKSLHEKAGRCA